MAVVNTNLPEIAYISCPHLTADEDGAGAAMAAGRYSTLVDDGQSCSVLLLCRVCADVVKAGVLDEIVSRSIADSVRHFGLK